MKRSTTRWALTGCMALAAMGAAAVFDAGVPTADAAPSVSPFAGSYVGPVPGSSYTFSAVTISDSGRFTGTGGSGISGRVSDGGSYSMTVSETSSWYDERRNRTIVATIRWTLAGTMTLDAAGDIVGTTDTGGSFVWRRR
jgi:hypothetical protein